MLLSVVLLVSCNQGEENYFDIPRTLYITFSDAGGECTGILEVSGERYTFSPDVPRGLVITFDGEKGEVSYKGITFEGSVTDALRIKGAVDAVKDGTAGLKFDKKGKLSVIESEKFNIKVHKEATK